MMRSCKCAKKAMTMLISLHAMRHVVCFTNKPTRNTDSSVALLCPFNCFGFLFFVNVMLLVTSKTLIGCPVLSRRSYQQAWSNAVRANACRRLESVARLAFAKDAKRVALHMARKRMRSMKNVPIPDALRAKVATRYASYQAKLCQQWHFSSIPLHLYSSLILLAAQALVEYFNEPVWYRTGVRQEGLTWAELPLISFPSTVA